MQVDSVEQLQVWQAARRLVEALSAITHRGALARDQRLREQIDGCADSILSNLAEGFEQGTDRAFARYLYIARGSCAEVKAHLAVAQERGHLAAGEADRLRADGAEIGRMLTGLIDHLIRSDRKRRR
jgi:four helix bundle protein